VSDDSGKDSGVANKRGPRPFPVNSFSDSLALAQTIYVHGASDRMRRLTVFDKLGLKPESGTSRQLISNSNKYGLTAGNVTSEYLTLTDEARIYLGESTPGGEKLRIGFSLAIAKNDIFASLYERLKDKRLPVGDVLRDEVAQVGVAADQCDQAGRIFIENARQLGLVRELSGVERLVAVEQLIEEQPTAAASQPLHAAATPISRSIGAGEGSPNGSGSEMANGLPTPSVHIDVQIHIDASASPEQIDQIFSSMARHLYGRED
jgi:hypothetical protein